MVSSGQRVQQGTPIASLSLDQTQANVASSIADANSAQAALATAQAQQQQAEAQRAKAAANVQLQRTQFNRTQQLVSQGAIAREQSDIARNNLQTAIADLQAAEKQVAAARAAVRQGQANIRQAQANQKPTLKGGVFTQFIASTPQFQIDFDRTRLEALNIDFQQAVSTLSAAIGSQYVNDFTLGQRTYRVYVQSDANYRRSPDDIRRLYVRSANNQMVSLSEVAKITPTTDPSVISHYNGFLLSPSSRSSPISPTVPYITRGKD